jgi:hypothetical protein
MSHCNTANIVTVSCKPERKTAIVLVCISHVTLRYESIAESEVFLQGIGFFYR